MSQGELSQLKQRLPSLEAALAGLVSDNANIREKERIAKERIAELWAEYLQHEAFTMHLQQDTTPQVFSSAPCAASLGAPTCSGARQRVGKPHEVEVLE